MRGRKPTATSRKKLAGNPGHRKLNTAEPQPPTSDFETPPKELHDQPAAAAEWRRLAPMLARIRQVTDADRSALLALCLEWGRYLEATAQTAKLGMVVKAPSGYPMTNPYLSIATKALAGCAKLWPELGLTPSSRSRVKTAAADEAASDPFAEFDEPLPTGARPH